MTKFSGLNLAKHTLEWDCHDRHTELEHFKTGLSEFLFEGPLVRHERQT